MTDVHDAIFRPCIPARQSPQPVGDSPLFPMTSPFSSLATSALTSGEVDRILGTLDRGWNPAAGYLGSSVTMGAPTSSFVSQRSVLRHIFSARLARRLMT